MTPILKIILSAIVIYYFGYIWGAIAIITLFCFIGEGAEEQTEQPIKKSEYPINTPNQYPNQKTMHTPNQYLDRSTIHNPNQNTMYTPNQYSNQEINQKPNYYPNQEINQKPNQYQNINNISQINHINLVTHINQINYVNQPYPYQIPKTNTSYINSNENINVDDFIAYLKIDNPKIFMKKHFYCCLNSYNVDELKELCRLNGLILSNKNKSQLIETIIEFYLLNESKRCAITKSQIEMFTVEGLKEICRSIGLTYSRKNKDQLVNEIYKIFIYADSLNYTNKDLKNMNLEDFNVEYLKSFLRARGGKVSGNKPELIMNLRLLIK